MATTNIIHLQLKETDEHYYFGSLVALSDMFGKDAIGVTYGTLRTYMSLYKTSEDGMGIIFENNKCIIRRGLFHPKKTKRGRAEKEGVSSN